MTLGKVALIVAVAALLVSVVANVVAFTRPAPGIHNGSIELADLAPDTRAQLQGEPGEPGTRGPRGKRGTSGPAGPPGLPGADAPDVSARVENLETIVLDRICDTWISVQDVNGDNIWRKFC